MKNIFFPVLLCFSLISGVFAYPKMAGQVTTEPDKNPGRVSDTALTNGTPPAERKPETDSAGFRIGASLSYILGFTLYRIGRNVELPDGDKFDTGFYFSQLKFPISTVAAGLDIQIPFSPKVVFSANLKKNIPFVSGKMEDSDWGVWYLSGYSWAEESTLDIFSESDTLLDMWKASAMIDIFFLNKPFIKVSFRPGLEYTRQFFTISNLKQWYPSYERYSTYLGSSYSGAYYQDGIVLTYAVNAVDVLFAGTVGLNWGNTRLGIEVAPVIGYLWNVDDHMLRKKIAEGYSITIGLKGAVEYGITFSERLTLSLRLDGEYQDGVGSQKQRRYEATIEGPVEDIATTDMETETLYGELSFKLQYRF